MITSGYLLRADAVRCASGWVEHFDRFGRITITMEYEGGLYYVTARTLEDERQEIRAVLPKRPIWRRFAAATLTVWRR